MKHRAQEGFLKYRKLCLCAKFYHDVTRKDSVQSHHTIVDLIQEFCDFIGHFLFLWRHDKIKHIGIFDITETRMYIFDFIIPFINNQLKARSLYFSDIYDFNEFSCTNPQKVNSNSPFKIN